jgi:hypothetical protein
MMLLVNQHSDNWSSKLNGYVIDSDNDPYNTEIKSSRYPI